MNERYPEVAEALAAQRQTRFVVDGEVVAFSGSRTSFETLARRGERGVRVFYYVFDLLWLDGYDVRPLPLRSRKRLLRDAIEFGDPLRFTPHRNRDGERFFAEACRKGWEGLIAKRADSPYSSSRSRDWLKFKCDRSQEMVIGGFTPPKGSREELGRAAAGPPPRRRSRLRREGGHGLHARDRSRTWPRSSARCAATTRRLRTRARSRSAA